MRASQRARAHDGHRGAALTLAVLASAARFSAWSNRFPDEPALASVGSRRGVASAPADDEEVPRADNGARVPPPRRGVAPPALRGVVIDGRVFGDDKSSGCARRAVFKPGARGEPPRLSRDIDTIGGAAITRSRTKARVSKVVNNTVLEQDKDVLP